MIRVRDIFGVIVPGCVSKWVRGIAAAFVSAVNMESINAVSIISLARESEHLCCNKDSAGHLTEGDHSVDFGKLLTSLYFYRRIRYDTVTVVIQNNTPFCRGFAVWLNAIICEVAARREKTHTIRCASQTVEKRTSSESEDVRFCVIGNKKSENCK